MSVGFYYTRPVGLPLLADIFEIVSHHSNHEWWIGPKQKYRICVKLALFIDKQ